MGKEVIVKAKNKEEAIDFAISKLGEDISRDQLEVITEEKNKKWMGIISKKNTYKIIYNKEKIEDENDNEENIINNVNMDGKFKIKINSKGVFARVIPAQGEGNKVQYLKAKEKLEKKQIVEVDWEKVQDIINKPEDDWVKIAPRKPELDRDAEIKVKISDDKLKAYIDYYPALGGEKITFEKIENILEKENVVFGIKTERIKKIIRSENAIDNFLIAEGKSPIPGKDAKLDYHFEQKKESIGTKKENGRIDFYDLGLVKNVDKGDVLVTLEKAEPGQKGKTVTGVEILPEKPKTKTLPSGKNVIKKDETTLVSEIKGQVVETGSKLNVLQVYEINGDVDLSVGNIDFVGNVLVKGSVQEGFGIKAEGNVEIKGSIFAADIEAKGEVIVHGGFIGKDKYKINAKDEVRVKFVENGIIKSDNSIFVKNAVMHSKLIADKKIKVIGNKGLIVGGIQRAGQEIEANIVGNNMATHTELEAGHNPDIKERLSEIKPKLEELNRNLMKTNRALNILQRKKQSQNELKTNQIQVYEKLKNTKKELNDSISNYENETEVLQGILSELTQGKIIINKKVFPGVKIIVGKASLNISDSLETTIFIEDSGEIRKKT